MQCKDLRVTLSLGHLLALLTLGPQKVLALEVSRGKSALEVLELSKPPLSSLSPHQKATHTHSVETITNKAEKIMSMSTNSCVFERQDTSLLSPLFLVTGGNRYEDLSKVAPKPMGMNILVDLGLG